MYATNFINHYATVYKKFIILNYPTQVKTHCIYLRRCVIITPINKLALFLLVHILFGMQLTKESQNLMRGEKMGYDSLLKIFHSDKENYQEIYKRRFNSEYAVHLDFSIHDSPAFFMQEPSLYEKLIKIYKTDKKIQSLCYDLPNQAISHFETRCLIDEIILTNDIEGVYSSRKEINLLLNELETKSKGKRFWGLVQKYLMLQNENEIPFVTCQDIRTLYNELVYSEIKKDDPSNLPDGKIFRKESASVMSSTQKEIHRGINPENKIIECMDSALKILNNNEIGIVFRVAIFHYLFGYIHPFYDGNGRTSRFISSYFLSREFEPLIGYRISYTIKENIKKYYEAFKTCNNPYNRGDLTPFIIMFTDILEASMEQLVFALEKRFKSLMHYHRNIYLLPYGFDLKYFDLYSVLIQASLFAENGISTQELMDTLSLSRTTIKNRLSVLEKENLIVKKAIGNIRSYSINLDEVDSIIIKSSTD